ncbi:MAG: autotransporter domain-containing protein [Endomicrobium sp.]|jgi:predicted outer membrane repeat protein|nr:autotransporter domain-containing protein [Endomicrobium sp.]
MKHIISYFSAVTAAVFLFCTAVHAVPVVIYNEFETQLSAGNNVELNQNDIIKSSNTYIGANKYTINISSALSITGNGHNIDLSSFGNMITISPGITVAITSAAIVRGNNAADGGAISMGSNSGLNINGITYFNVNHSSMSGGAISLGNSSSLNVSGNITFSSNSASNSGGALFFSDGASADFSNSELTASGNRAKAGNGGFLSAANAGAITFATATFTGNVSVSSDGYNNGLGGVIYSSGSSVNINFTRDVSFINNTGHSAGAMYMTNGAQATFSGENTLFQGNNGAIEVGALLVRYGSSVTFQGENTTFKNNFMTDNRYGTGAVDVAYGAFADFTATKVTAQGNNAGVGRGGFLWADSSQVDFGDVLIGGNANEGNTAYYGGGIYSGNHTVMNFGGTDAAFRNNRAYIDGGGLYVTTASAVAFFTASSTTFWGNTAGRNGGAAAVTGSSSVEFNSTYAYFYGNSAAVSGGAISIEDGGRVDVINGNFVSNHANNEGGAVYVRGSTSTAQYSAFYSHTTSTGTSETIFRGNSTNGQDNAIYLDEYGSAYFDAAAGTSIEMNNGISGSTNTTTYFEFSGAGDFNLYGSFDTLDLTSRGAFNLKAGSFMNASTVNNETGAKFNMENGVIDTAYMKTLNNSGALGMDISRTKNDVIVVSEKLNLDATSSVLEIKAADDMTGAEFRKKIYKLINYGEYEGDFSTVLISSSVILTKAPVVEFGEAYANWVTLSIFGNKNSTEFGKIDGETFNQQETGSALDKISESVADNSPWDLALSDLETYNADNILEILTHLSGYFLPNVIRNAVTDNPHNEIYDKIRDHCRQEYHSISNGLWVQAAGSVQTFNENDNSPENYKDTSTGIMAGYDRFIKDSNMMLGIYGRFNNDSIEQGKNKADGKRTGAGIYAGYIKEDWELKALSLLSFDSFNTKRYVPYPNATADAEIKTTALSFDLEGAFKFDIAFNTKFRPYAGFELANANYGAFKESGAGIFNLDVKGGNYLRTAGRIGAGVHYEEDIWNFYANAEGKYLLGGSEPEIENVFEGTNASFKTRGAKEGNLEFGIGAGISLKLTKSFEIFANTGYFGANKYENIYGNIGLRFIFCKSSQRKVPEYDSYQYVQQPVAQLQPVPVLPPEPPVMKSEDIDMTDKRIVEEQKIEAMKRREKPVLKSYSLNMASFAVGKADLTDAAKKDITREAEEIKQFDYKRIVIEGHTDSTGGDLLNTELSKARAKAVYDEFTLHDIPEEKMMYLGFGPAMPRDTNSTVQGRANNRRVEIFVE